MIKREFKVNFKNFVIWLSILLGMFLLVYLIYPYIITEETMKQLGFDLKNPTIYKIIEDLETPESKNNGGLSFSEFSEQMNKTTKIKKAVMPTIL